MSAPRFSIVIPTRNRAATLAFTLQTCRSQAFEDFEVIVSDNDSPPQTRAVVEACADKRVKYVRTPAPLAMTDSWEFACEQASGEFVTVIGDDDGYLLHALTEIDRLLRLVDARVLRWDSVLYNWPDLARQQYAQPNGLLIPLRMEKAHHAIRAVDAAEVVPLAANSQLNYAELPMIYCSAVHQDILRQLRQKTGRVFKGRTPDIYSAFAIAWMAGTYHTVNAPLNIAGLSGKSTGVAHLFVKDRNAVDEDFRTLNDRAGHSVHPIVPDLPRLPALVADAFLHAQDALGSADPASVLDRKQLIANCLRETEAEGEWKQVLAVCRLSLADDAELLTWFDSTYGDQPFDALPRTTRRQVEKRYGGTYLNLDASEFGVSDVASAAVLCEKLLGYQRDGVNASLRTTAEAVSPLSELQEKEAMIQLLDRTCRERLAVIEQLTAQVEALESQRAVPPPTPTRFRDVLRRILRRGARKAA